MFEHFGSKRNPSDFYGILFLEPKRFKKVFFSQENGSSSFKNPFWEHGASKHLMVLGKIAKKCF